MFRLSIFLLERGGGGGVHGLRQVLFPAFFQSLSYEFGDGSLRPALELLQFLG